MTIIRNQNLDLIKWLAMASMVIDHLRYMPFLSNQANVLLMLGRIAFPFFCLALAVNALRPQAKISSYVFKLILFAVLSELPYRWYVGTANAVCLNILPTLLLGLLLCLAIFKTQSGFMQFVALVILSTLALLLNPILMYGAIGMVLPLTCAVTIKYGLKWLWLPMLFAGAATYQFFYPVWSWTIAAVIGSATLAPVLGFLLLKRPITWTVMPVTHWGYWFYPLHFMVLYFIRTVVH